jgi:hypothetical protein
LRSDGVFLGAILESGGMEMSVRTVGSFQIFGDTLDSTCVLHVGVHFYKIQRFPDDYLFDQIHCEQLLNSVNSADNAGEDSK